MSAVRRSTARRVEARPTRLRVVRDYGLLDADRAAWDAGMPRSLAEIEAGLVGEAEMRRHGRWGGAPPPRRWFPR